MQIQVERTRKSVADINTYVHYNSAETTHRSTKIKHDK